MKNILTEEINRLRQNARSVVRELGLLNDAYFEIGVTLAERHLLIELMCCDSPTMGEIAERLLLDKSTASRLIARALKKGYIECSSDEKDKRRRFVRLTQLGQETLNAFEPIAFTQTKEALLCLSAEEADLVHQGVALYAKGLKTSRLNRTTSVPSDAGPKDSDNKTVCVEPLSDLHEKLGRLGMILRPFHREDEIELHTIFREVVDTGAQFPYESSSKEEFHRQFFGSESMVYVCQNSSTKEVVGGFYLKPNYSGRSNHIANAAYMMKGSCRGQGIGTLLIKASLQIAKERGFRAMQFNMVLSQNIAAIRLYRKLGFNIVGTLPRAIRNPDGSYQDGYVLHRALDQTGRTLDRDSS